MPFGFYFAYLETSNHEIQSLRVPVADSRFCGLYQVLANKDRKNLDKFKQKRV